MTLTDETKSLLSDDLINTMKDTAILVAIEHALFNNQLVLEKVNQNKLYGFGFEAEPQAFNKYEGNVWAAPAYAWATDSTMHNSLVKLIDNMVDAASGSFPNRIK